MSNSEDNKKNKKLPTVQEQAEIFNATEWEYNNGYADFYHAGVFRGSSNLKYLRANSNKN